MSEQVSRAEFNELKGQLNLVCQHLGLELGDLVVQGTGRRRAAVEETVESPKEEFAGFAADEEFKLSEGYNVVPEDTNDDEGWESINDDEDPEHTISPQTEEEELPVAFADEEDEEDDLPVAFADEDAEEDGPVEAPEHEEAPLEAVYSLDNGTEVTAGEVRDNETYNLGDVAYVDDESTEDEDAEDGVEEAEEEGHPYDKTPVLHEAPTSGITPDILSAIFDAEGALTAHEVAAQEFTDIKKTLFTSPYNVEEVDDFLDEYLEVLQSRDISEAKYAEALLNLDGKKFSESSEGYKKSEVDNFLGRIATELQRRIDIVG